jgi:hypothetical protein
MIGIDLDLPFKLCNSLVKLLLSCVDDGQEVVSFRKVRKGLKEFLIGLL